MLVSETGSEEFDRFINLLGDRVRLKGWDKYRGGLDVKGEHYFVFNWYYFPGCMRHLTNTLRVSRVICPALDATWKRRVCWLNINVAFTWYRKLLGTVWIWCDVCGFKYLYSMLRCCKNELVTFSVELYPSRLTTTRFRVPSGSPHIPVSGNQSPSIHFPQPSIALKKYQSDGYSG